VRSPGSRQQRLPRPLAQVMSNPQTLLVHGERSDGVLAHKDRHVQHIVDAFERMQARRTAM
jgi:hypothetical protein